MARVWSEIHVDNYAKNLVEFRRNLDPDLPVAAVIKADAYGLGAVEAARALNAAGCERFAVAGIMEGLELRESGIRNPIHVLGSAFTEYELFGLAVETGLTLTITSVDEARILAAAVGPSRRRAQVHLKIETGMHRFGMQGFDILEAVMELTKTGRVDIEGAYTHFHSANDPKGESVRRQLLALGDVRRWLLNCGVRLKVWHAAASAGSIFHSASQLDMVRPGIVLHGIRNWSAPDTMNLSPVLSMATRVSAVHTIEAGETVGYGATHRCAHKSTIATLSAGYADGYHRELSNKGEALVHGIRCPIVGLVCMDAMMVDVTDLTRMGMPVKAGDVATLIGRDGSNEIRLETLAAMAGVNPYTFSCKLGNRVEKRYLREKGTKNVQTVDFSAVA